MHTVAQIIEALQINNLPHLPNGDFIITEKQQQSILSLLSQQVVESDEEIKKLAWKKGEEYMDGYRVRRNAWDYKEGFLDGYQHARQQPPKTK